MIMELFIKIYKSAAAEKLLILCAIAIVVDTIFGLLRAIKERKFNSNFGINGAIRKGGMLISIMSFVIVDYILKINFIGFLPETMRQGMQQYLGFSFIGVTDFFCILYLTYEVSSILKNMSLCGLPVKNLWLNIQKFLAKYTDELPVVDEVMQELIGEEQEEMEQEQEEV